MEAATNTVGLITVADADEAPLELVVAPDAVRYLGSEEEGRLPPQVCVTAKPRQ